MAQLYDHTLMLSIAIQNAPSSLIVPISHSEPSTKALKRLIQTELTQKVTHLALGDFRMSTVPDRHGLLSRIESKPAYPFQHFTEHIPRDHHLGKLEHEPPGMAHQPPADLYESRLNTCQRPALYRFWQSQPSEEVAQIVCQKGILATT